MDDLRTLGLPSDEVASAVARSAEGSTNIEYGIRGGAPYGGACLPKDVAGFLGLGDRLDLDLHMTEAVADVNRVMEERRAPKWSISQAPAEAPAIS